MKARSFRDYDVLLFDLDGTLVDSARAIAAALTQVNRRRSERPIPADEVRSLISHGVATLVSRTLGSAPSELNDDIIAFRTELERTPLDPMSVYPGVIDALEVLWLAHFSMAVVTNKPESLSRKLLDSFGLTRFFHVLVGGDTTKHSKPHPDPVQRAFIRLGSPPSRGVLIGDSAVDAAAAAAMALPFILFEGGYDPAGCDPYKIAGRFSNFLDLPKLLAG